MLTKILFLFPKYIVRQNPFEYSEDVIVSLLEYLVNPVKSKKFSSITYKVIFYDVVTSEKRLSDSLSFLSDGDQKCLVALHGPNPEFFPSEQEFGYISQRCNGFKLLIATDGFREDYCSLLLRYVCHFTHYLELGSKQRDEIFKRNVIVSHSLFFIPSQKLRRFYSDSLVCKRDLDISIFGSVYPDRQKIIKFFDSSESFGGPTLNHFGGSYDKRRLLESDYIGFSKRTKLRIVCTYNWDGKFRHMKGHVYETLLSGALLLIDHPDVLPEWSAVLNEANFVPFNSEADLWQKAKTLLSQADKVSKLASRGYNSALRDINKWDMVLR